MRLSKGVTELGTKERQRKREEKENDSKEGVLLNADRTGSSGRDGTESKQMQFWEQGKAQRRQHDNPVSNTDQLSKVAYVHSGTWIGGRRLQGRF